MTKRCPRTLRRGRVGWKVRQHAGPMKGSSLFLLVSHPERPCSASWIDAASCPARGVAGRPMARLSPAKSGGSSHRTRGRNRRSCRLQCEDAFRSGCICKLGQIGSAGVRPMRARFTSRSCFRISSRGVSSTQLRSSGTQPAHRRVDRPGSKLRQSFFESRLRRACRRRRAAAAHLPSLG